MADIDASNWDSTDANNTTASPDGMPEGMAPSGVNNWGRAVAGALKRFRNYLSPKVSAGTTTAFTLSYDVAPGALYDTATHLVRFNAANGAAATLNVNTLGAKPIYTYQNGAWAAAPTGILTADTIRRVSYDSASGAYRVHDIQSSGTWTPTDGSGAGLTFTGVNAFYQVINNMVYAYARVTYPATASGAGAIISGLPLTVANKLSALIPAPVQFTGGAGISYIVPNQNATTASFILASTGAAITNTSMAGFSPTFCLVYPAS